MYAFDSRIRYSETDSEGYLTLDALLNYFQDCSTFHSEDVGLGIGYMKEIGQVWVLSSWQIVVNRYPKLGEKVKIVTLPYELKVFLGYRNFAMLDEKGEYIAKANCLWSLLDVATGKPVIVNEAMRKGYADKVFIVTSGENMSIHAAANIAMAIDNFKNRGYASLGGLILNRRNVKREDEKVA